jgi:hypothetical protein
MEAIFGSKTKAQEILCLLEGAKDVVRHGYYDHELESVERFCREAKIHLVKSNFKVLLDEKKGYSNKGFRMPIDEKKAMRFVYMSKSELKANLAAYYELKGMDKELGLVLGYPKCCVDFFCRNFSTERTNLQLKPTNPYTNLRKRSEDAVLISHFPCNSSCGKSIEMAKRHLSIIRKYDPKRADDIMEILNDFK